MKNSLLITFLACFASLVVSASEGEKILGYQPTKNGIIFQVNSGGCTHQADFLAQITYNRASNVKEVVLTRTRQDLCYPLIPMGERFSFTYEELGLNRSDRFVVKNQNGIVYGYVWPEVEP